MEIIDFHIHPFNNRNNSICIYKSELDMSADIMSEDMKRAGISRFCGSVISMAGDGFEKERLGNVTAFRLRDELCGDYIPGIQINASYVDESCEEIDLAYSNGCVMVGELVPYFYGWSYSDDGFKSILEHTRGKIELYSLHTMDFKDMERLAIDFPYVNFVFAHPGENDRIACHIDIMKRCDNVYLDLSGTGIFRYGMLKHLVNEVGSERILFGTDYPICNPASYIHGVEYERISDREKENIFSENAKRVLCIN